MSECTCTDFANICKKHRKDLTFTRKGNNIYTPEGELMCWVDSFGFRDRYPGECEPCWEAQKAGAKKALSGLSD